MALKESNRKVTVDRPQIGVNRGQSSRAVGSAIASGNLTGTINNFLKSKIATLKEAEQAKGEQLGKSVELVYEDYTDENGKTYKIASSYATPENLISTSWAASKFEEEAAETLLSGLLTGVDEIVQNEKLNIKSTISLNSSVAEINAAFRNKLSEPLSIIEQNVPDEFKAVYQAKKEQMVLAAASEISNKHIRMSDTYNNKVATFTMNTAFENMTTLSYTDPKRADQLYEDTRDKLELLSAKSSVEAQFLLKEKLRGLEIIKDIGANLQKYTTADYSSGNAQNIRAMAKNVPELQKLFNQGPGSSVTVINIETGKEEKISFESLGLSNEELMTHGDELRKSFGLLGSLIGSKSTEASKNLRIMNKINMGFNLGGRYLTDKADIKFVAKELDNPDSDINQDLLMKFNSENPQENLTPFNFSDPNKAASLEKYYTFVASNTGVVSDSYKTYIEGNLINNHQNFGAIQKMVTSGRWSVLTSATVHPTNNTAVVTDVLSSMGMSEKAEKTAIMLRRSIKLYGVNDGIEYFQENMREIKDDLIPLSTVATQLGYNNIREFRNKVQSKIVEAHADTLFTIKSDGIITNRFVKNVADDILRSMQHQSGLDINEAVADSLMKIEKGGSYGMSQYSIGMSMITSSDEIELDSGMESYVQFPPDEYIETPGQIKLIQDRLDSVHRDMTKFTNNRYIDEDEKLELGKNVFLQVIGNPADISVAQYRFVYADNDGTNQRILIDNSGNTLSINMIDLMEARDN